MNLRARRFMRDSIAEDLTATDERVRRSIVLLARTGQPPSVAELR
jgi:hypothetical protein